jgi:hypothetical protein
LDPHPAVYKTVEKVQRVLVCAVLAAGWSRGYGSGVPPSAQRPRRARALPRGPPGAAADLRLEAGWLLDGCLVAVGLLGPRPGQMTPVDRQGLADGHIPGHIGQPPLVWAVTAADSRLATNPA